MRVSGCEDFERTSVILTFFLRREGRAEGIPKRVA